MRIELTSAAQRQLKKLRRNLNLTLRLKQALMRIGTDAYIGKALDGEFTGIRAFRVGEFRILYEIHEHELVVLVLEIADRKEVYRK